MSCSQTHSKIVMVLDAPYPSDVRVYKEARALTEAGFAIHLICRRRPGEPLTESLDGMQVERLVATPKVWLKRLNTLCARGLFWDPLWFFTLGRRLSDLRPLAVHVHDLPLLGTVKSLAWRRQGLKVVADLHENYPAGLQSWGVFDSGPWSWLMAQLNGYRRWSRYERRILGQVDELIAVVSEMKDRLIQHQGVSEEKISVVSNLEEKSFAQKADIGVDPSIGTDQAATLPAGFKMIYAGGFGQHRGLHTAIRGMSKLRDLPIQLVLIGRGPKGYEDYLRQIISQEELQGQVTLIPWVTFSTLKVLMHQCDVGVIPHESNEHTDHTVPHKIYQYMLCALPLLVSDCKPLARITRALDAGEVFLAGDSSDFAEKARRLYEHPEYRKQLGLQGQKATLDGPHNWEAEGQKLVAVYRRLASVARLNG